ncbi:MAG: hypothetical protein CVV27_00525 [Candidatus Melainabacteria bacterium HGW-Melainabacteria-1]|nr:MAG: hypothetical protein CVV27_00525 [Candidatus Melainabacteria bacterium HGW-Melainabacteria-1]
MQNLKIQTLWQLCQELKQKRQSLVEKLSHTQSYLDRQQTLMSTELLSLRHRNDELSSDLTQLHSHLETLRKAWQGRDNGAPATLDQTQIDLQNLAFQFERLAGELTFATLLAQAVGAAELSQLQALGAEFDPWYTRLHELRLNAGNESVAFLIKAESFVPEFHTSLSASRQALADSFGLAPAAQGDEASAMLQVELETLRGQYQSLQDELDAIQNRELDREQDLEGKDAQLGDMLQTVQTIQDEFDALRASNGELAEDMSRLTQQTDQLIGLVETYRQVALAAASEAGMNDEPEAESGDAGDAEDEEGGASKAEAVREAVRKKLNTLLRHRFGKVPRKLSNAFKEIHSGSKLDKLFDKALKVESIEEFEAGLEA